MSLLALQWFYVSIPPHTEQTLMPMTGRTEKEDKKKTPTIKRRSYIEALHARSSQVSCYLDLGPTVSLTKDILSQHTTIL